MSKNFGCQMGESSRNRASSRRHSLCRPLIWWWRQIHTSRHAFTSRKCNRQWSHSYRRVYSSVEGFRFSLSFHMPTNIGIECLTVPVRTCDCWFCCNLQFKDFGQTTSHRVKQLKCMLLCSQNHFQIGLVCLCLVFTFCSCCLILQVKMMYHRKT